MGTKKTKKRKVKVARPARCASARKTWRNHKHVEVRCKNHCEPDSDNSLCYWCAKSNARALKLSNLSEAIAEVVDLTDLESRIDELESRFN